MTTALVHAEPAVRALEQRSAMLPAMSIAEAVERFNMMVEYTQKIMRSGIDFGEIPGTDKPTLLKPGAEKLSTFFGLTPKFEIVEKTQDWTGAEHGGEPFFYYMVKCRLFRGERFMGEGDGLCNSWESRYRYRWVPEHEVPAGVDRSRCRKRGGKISEFNFSVEKAETGGKYGKPAEYWQKFKDAIEAGEAKSIRKKTKDGREFEAWEIDSTVFRIPNSDIADAVNTVLKISCKRAMIAAVLITTNASEYYTQDLDDLEIIDAEYSVRQPQQAPAPQQAPPKPAPATNGHAAPAKSTSPANGAELEAAVREVAAKWEKAGYCPAATVFLKLADFAHGQGCDKPMKDWPQEIIAGAGDYLRRLLTELKKPAPKPMLDTIDHLTDELGWSADYREECLANANLLQPGEIPNEHRAQSVILYMQQLLRDETEAVSAAAGADEKEEIPF